MGSLGAEISPLKQCTFCCWPQKVSNNPAPMKIIALAWNSTCHSFSGQPIHIPNFVGFGEGRTKNARNKMKWPLGILADERHSYQWVCGMLKRKTEKEGYGARPPNQMCEAVSAAFRAEVWATQLKNEGAHHSTTTLSLAEGFQFFQETKRSDSQNTKDIM